MAAHLRNIYERKCCRCGQRAVVILNNYRNEELAAYCRKHGAVALKEEQQYEEARQR